MSQYLAIDEDGYFSSAGIRLNDIEQGFSLLENLRLEQRTYVTQLKGQRVVVEAFDQPLVAQSVDISENGIGIISLPYSYMAEFSLDTLTVDDWDRFHGRTTKGLPFVLTRHAQMQLFNCADEFDDESLTIRGRKIAVPHMNDKENAVNEKFWRGYYQEWQKNDILPPWEQTEVTSALKQVLPQIKIPKSRICILGCGTGHDAHHFSEQGHIVTAVDLSPEAIEKARTLYKESENLKFVVADAFEWAKDHYGEFDIVYERTFFCAVEPKLRRTIVDVWRKLLSPRGHLLGLFFVFDRLPGPPFGATEWEIREALKSSFQNLYWTRWRQSPEKYLGIELVVYAQKK